MKKQYQIILALTISCIISFSCAKDDDDLIQSSSPGLFFKATIDGKEYEIKEGESGYVYLEDYDTRLDFENNRWYNHISYLGNHDTSIVAAFMIHKKYPKSMGIPSKQQMSESVKTGSMPILGLKKNEEGIKIGFSKAIGSGNYDAIHTSSISNDNQEGSSFNITKSIEVSDGISMKIITANFNCKLYSQDGDTFYLTNGTARMRMIDPNQ